MLRKLLLYIAALPLLAVCANVTIVENNLPKAELIIGTTPTKTAQFAAFEMQHCIELMTKATLPILAEPTGTDGITQIKIGMGADQYDFTGEEYVVSYQDGKIILVGNDNQDFGKVDYQKESTFPPMEYYYRASLFAVYDFLEKACGFRFYSFGDEGIAFKPCSTLNVSPFESRRKPEMDAFRAPYFEGAGNAAVSKRDKNLLLQRWRNVYAYGYTNHNIYSIYYRYWAKSINKNYADLFIEPHPEWFAQRKEGRQNSHVSKDFSGNYVPSQLCYSAEGPIKYFAEEANKVFHGESVKGARFGNIKKLPKAEFYYPIQPDDDQAVCQCPGCTKLMEHDRLAYHFTWINKLAAEVHKINPEINLATLAYGVARRRPTDIEIAPNVSIQICMSPQAWFHPVIYKRQHDTYKDWVEHEGGKRMLTSWLYFLNPEIEASRGPFKPFPVLYPRHTGEYVTEFLNDGIRGVFAEIAINSHELEAYVMSRLIYDKSQDYNSIIDEYFTLYYGAAGSYMKQVYDTIESISFNPANYPENVVHRDYPGSYIAGIHNEKVNWTLGTPDRMIKIHGLVEKAKSKAATPVERARVDRFVKQIWGPAEEGYKNYLAHLELQKNPLPKMALPSLAKDCGGDLEKVDFENGAKITDWRFAFGEEYDSNAEMRIIVDSDYFYFKFVENDDKPYEFRNIGFWRNGLEFFFADEPGVNYRQMFIDVSGEYEFYRNDLVEGVERFERQYDLKIKIQNELSIGQWTLIGAIPLSAISNVTPGMPLHCNVIRSRLYNETTNHYFFSPIFSKTHRDGLERLGLMYMPEKTSFEEKTVEDIQEFVRGKKQYKHLPMNWEMDKDNQLKHEITKDGHFVLKGTKLKNGFVYNTEFFPIAPGQVLEYEITGSCVGNAGCCAFMSNGKDIIPLGKNWISIHPTETPITQKIVVKIPTDREQPVTYVRIGLQLAPKAELDLTKIKVTIK